MIYLIADLHLNHANIIKYCNRPFSSVREMNNTIIRNWNNTVNEDDIVYLVGDLCFPKGHKTSDWWLSKLNGDILLIRGNHDRDTNGIPCVERYILKYGGYEFLLVHRPYDREGWSEWCISGHVHNNASNKYPFINHENKNINVCVEFLDYTPISIENLVIKIENGSQI